MLIKLSLELVVYFLVNLVPKKKGLWLFSSWFGEQYSDNPRAIFECSVNYKINKESFWLVKDLEIYRELKEKELKVVYAYSLDGILKQIRASVVVYTHHVASEFVACLISSKTKRVNTWHGIPIKKIDSDAEQGWDGIKFNIKKYIFRHRYSRNDLVFACGEDEQIIYSRAFRTKLSSVKVVGYARYDSMLKAEAKKSDRRKIIYMPTYRGVMGDDNSIIYYLTENINLIDEILGELNCSLDIKLHPMQSLDSGKLPNSGNIKILDKKEIDFNLKNYEAVITDFSGVYFDALILGVPLIMAPFDLDKYIDQRGIYYEYDEICVGSKCLDWHAVLLQAKDILHEKNYNFLKHQLLKKRFHKFDDGNASLRACNEIYTIDC